MQSRIKVTKFLSLSLLLSFLGCTPSYTPEGKWYSFNKSNNTDSYYIIDRKKDGTLNVESLEIFHDSNHYQLSSISGLWQYENKKLRTIVIIDSIKYEIEYKIEKLNDYILKYTIKMPNNQFQTITESRYQDEAFPTIPEGYTNNKVIEKRN